MKEEGKHSADAQLKICYYNAFVAWTDLHKDMSNEVRREVEYAFTRRTNLNRKSYDFNVLFEYHNGDFVCFCPWWSPFLSVSREISDGSGKGLPKRLEVS